MYFNNTLIKMNVKTFTDTYGYKVSKFIRTKETYKADVQPYSKELLKKEYGIESDLVAYRCFLLKSRLKIFDYVCIGKDVYRVILLHKWENHTEIILESVVNERPR